MLKDFSLDKAILALITYLTLLSICYTNGYWSLFEINIFNYYGVQDILKSTVAPLFKFGGLLALPLLIIALTVLLLFKKINEEAEKESEALAKAQIGKKNGLLFNLFIIFIGIPGLVSILIIVIVGPFFLFPVEDEGDFALMYLKSLPVESILRALFACLMLPMCLPLVLDFIRVLTQSQARKLTVIIISFVSTLFISYHYGRIDALKLVSGYEFFYWIDNASIPHKYIAKVGSYNIFLQDLHYIKHDDSLKFSLDTLRYTGMVNVISEDSLKGLSLHYYHKTKTGGEPYKFRKMFKPIQ